MNRLCRQFAPHVYAVLRLVAGLMFAVHGVQKIFGIPGNGAPVALLSLMGFGAVVELVGGLLIALGFRAGLAAFVASGQMAVAYAIAHFPQGYLPISNGGELAVLYCFVFLYIAAQGSGMWSLDAALGKSGGGKS